jgi:hypothetical protein
MSKQDIIACIDRMIAAEVEHLKWLNGRRVGWFGSLFFPTHNKIIDGFIETTSTNINELAEIRRNYEKCDIDEY